jgi:uncharacterized protein
MTSKESAQDKELLERYRRASDTEAAAPSEAVRAAILAEGRRAAELRAKEVHGQPFDASRPAANDSRWKMTAFGTAGAALVAALIFAPRLWENAPPAPSNTTVAASADKAAPSQAGAAPRPKLESLPAAPDSSEPLQEIVVTQSTRKGSRAADAAAPKATGIQPRTDLPAPAERQRSETLAMAPLASSQNAARAAALRSAPQPAALQSAAASGDTALTAVLLNQGAALDARDDHGRTPLMLAVMQSRLDVVRLLLNRGADPNIADSTGRTPLQQAKQQNLREVAALLKQAGAR